MTSHRIDLDKARRELLSKSLHDIQCETALVWCARACVAAEMGLDHDATEYAHEAIEHAALCDDDTLLSGVRRKLAAFDVRV